MRDHEKHLAPLSLHNVTLPGSHDSAAYEATTQVMPGSLPWPLPEIIEIAEQASQPLAGFIQGWALTQDQNITQQLMNGIRYLDLRAGAIALAR